MSFQDEEFDFIIDKGTLDALLCGSGLENQLLKEISRVTKKNGKMLVISHGNLQMRQPIFSHLDKSYLIRYCTQ